MHHLLRLAILLQAVLLGCSANEVELPVELEETAKEQYTLEIGSRIANERTDTCSATNERCVGRSVYSPCDHESITIVCDQGKVCTMSNPDTMCIPAPPECTEVGYFRFPGSCDRYYVCMKTGNLMKQYIGTCEAGFEFSTRSGVCTEPEDAGCSIPHVVSSTTISSTSVSPSPTPPGPPPPFQCPGHGLFPDRNSCRHYYLCVRALASGGNGSLQATRMTCPLILPHFSPERRLCWFFSDACANGQCGL